MLEAIYYLLVNLMDGFYTSDNIFYTQQNNFTLPKDNAFIVITQGDTFSTGKPTWNFKQDDTTTITNFEYTNMQVDFYHSTMTAFNASERLKIALESYYATDFLSDYGFTIYEVRETKNLTDIFDSETYLKRFVINFSMFNNNQFIPSTPSFDTLTPDLILFPEGAN
jgi:hypothetical protein